MNPDRVCELEAAGVDPDGFHEDPDAPVPGALPADDGLLLGGGTGGEPLGLEEVPEDRPSGVYKRTQADRDSRRVVAEPGPEWVLPGDAGELAVSVRKVGCFLLRPDGFKRCRVFNLLTGFGHVTYGSDEEIDVEYARQTKSWKAKLSPVKRQGSGWRQTHLPQKSQG